MYREYSPSAELARVVECCWSIETGAALNHAVRPDGCIDIVYSRDMGLVAVGAMTTERRVTLSAASKTTGIRFRPGMAGPFLKVAPRELTDLMVPLEDLWGRQAHELERRLAEGRCAELTLAETLRGTPSGGNQVRRAIEAITAAHGVVDLDWIAAQAGMGPRQFRRRCFEESGLAPKQLCRILRFRRACQLAASRDRVWAAIAADAGYFDQAHLIRDFREFTGSAPMSVFYNTRALEAGHNRA